MHKKHNDLTQNGQPAPTMEATSTSTSPEEEAMSLEGRLAAAESRVAELDDLYKRSLAEAENTRRRAKVDIANAQKYGIERWASELIEVKDNLERALDVPVDCTTVEALHAGVELTLKQLVSAFGKVDLADIAPTVGSPFDPNCQQAMCTVDSDRPANQVVDVLRKGYRLGDRVLRPAQVVISRGADG